MKRATCSKCGDNIIYYPWLGQWYHADEEWRLGQGNRYEEHVRLGCFNKAVPGDKGRI